MKYTMHIYYAVIAYTLCTSILITYPTHCHVIAAQISCGELIDKITILKIKAERITDPEKLKNVCTELETLQKTRDECIDNYATIEYLQETLQKINQALWDIEDAIRV